jgi:hypothetical protein
VGEVWGVFGFFPEEFASAGLAVTGALLTMPADAVRVDAMLQVWGASPIRHADWEIQNLFDDHE